MADKLNLIIKNVSPLKLIVKEVEQTSIKTIGVQGMQGPIGQTGPQGIPGNPASNIVLSVNGQIGVVVLNADHISDSTTTKKFVTASDLTKLSNISGVNTGDISVTDSGEINFTLTGQNLTANLINSSIDETKLDSSVNSSLDLADSSLQVELDPVFTASPAADITNNDIINLSNLSGVNSGDQDLSPYFNKSADDLDDLTAGATNKHFTQTEKTKLSGIATGATANDTDANLKNRANHTGTQLSSTVSDFQSSVSSNTNVTANTAARHTHANKALLDTYTQTEANLADAVSKKHDDVTVTDSSEINFTLTGQNITANIIASSIDETKLDSSVNASLDLADTALQSETDPVFLSSDAFNITSTDIVNLGNLSGTNSGDQDLSDYVPYIGANANLNLGSNFIQTAGIRDDESTPILSIDPNARLLNRTDGTPILDYSNDYPLFKVSSSGNSGFYLEGGATPYFEFDPNSGILSTGNYTTLRINPSVEGNTAFFTGMYINETSPHDNSALFETNGKGGFNNGTQSAYFATTSGEAGNFTGQVNVSGAMSVGDTPNMSCYLGINGGSSQIRLADAGGTVAVFSNGTLGVDIGTATHAIDANGLVHISEKLGIGITTPTSSLHLRAGNASSESSPLKFESGTLMTVPEIGAFEFDEDKYLVTITTSSARKEIVLADNTLTDTRIPIVTTNGRLTDISSFYFDGSYLNVQSVIIADEIYNDSWNSSNHVPTKNAMYNKIEDMENFIIAMAAAL